ncbi:MAG TPA: acyl-CoA dehydrogenase family protein [Pseudonocardiaceae bacterium]
MRGIAPTDVAADAAFVAYLARSNTELLATGDHLPAEIVTAARAAGLFRLCLASELGGLRVPLPAIVEIIENLAHADGSLAWCVTVANVSASLLAGVDEDEARVVAAEPEKLITAGGFPPTGQGRRTDGGYELSGRWTFASGCMAATWFIAGMMAEQADGPPKPLIAYVPASAVRIVPNWDVTGLRATGSHDIVLADVLVPAGRTTPIVGGRRWSNDPIAAIPFFGLGVLLAAVPLGIARHALDELITVAGAKVSFGQREPLANDATFQGQFAAALARLRAARSFVLDQAREVWRCAQDGAITPDVQASAMLAVGEAGEAALAATRFAYQAVGTSSIRTSDTLSRCFNDVMVATRHVAFGQLSHQVAGRVSLGLPSGSPLLGG